MRADHSTHHSTAWVRTIDLRNGWKRAGGGREGWDADHKDYFADLPYSLQPVEEPSQGYQVIPLPHPPICCHPKVSCVNN